MNPISDCRGSHIGTVFQENKAKIVQNLEPCDPKMPYLGDFEKEININYIISHAP